MTVFHSVHWFFSLVQTALKKKLSPGMPLLHHVTLVLIIWHTIDFIFCEQSSTCFLLKTLENCFTMKSIMKIFAHIFFYGKPIIRYHKCLISSSFFFLTLFELCVGFFPALACWNIVSMSSGATPDREFGQYSFRVICPSPVTRTCVSDIHNLLRPCRRTVWG